MINKKNVISIGLNKYDSLFFKEKFGSVSCTCNGLTYEKTVEYLKNLSSLAQKNGYRYLFIKLTSKERRIIKAFLANGFKICDASIDFYLNPKKLSKIKVKNKNIRIRTAGVQDEPFLKKLASNAFIRSRFYNISFLSKAKVNEYHSKWIINLRQSRENKIFIADYNNNASGFIALNFNRKEKNCRIILFAVKNNLRGKGIGANLISTAVEYAAKSAKSIFVKTQEHNLPAIKCYEKLGFVPCKMEFGLHKLLRK